MKVKAIEGNPGNVSSQVIHLSKMNSQYIDSQFLALKGCELGIRFWNMLGSSPFFASSSVKVFRALLANCTSRLHRKNHRTQRTHWWWLCSATVVQRIGCVTSKYLTKCWMEAHTKKVNKASVYLCIAYSRLLYHFIIFASSTRLARHRIKNSTQQLFAAMRLPAPTFGIQNHLFKTMHKLPKTYWLPMSLTSRHVQHFQCLFSSF